MKRATLLAVCVLLSVGCNLEDEGVQVGNTPDNSIDIPANNTTANNATTANNVTTGTNVEPGTFQVVSVSPTDGATDVPTDTVVRITFNESVDSASVSNSDFEFKADDVSIRPGFSTSVDGAVVSIDLTPLTPGVALEIELVGEISSTEGLVFPPGFSTEFTTAIPPFDVVRTAPQEDAIEVPVKAVLEVEYSDEIDAASIGADSVVVSFDPAIPGGTASVQPDVTVEGRILRIASPRGSWREFQTLHTVELVNIRSVNGATAENETFAFTTQMFEDGVSYRIRNQGRPAQDFLNAEDRNKINTSGSADPADIEWQPTYIEQGLWQFRSPRFPDLLLESGDGSISLSLTPAAPAGQFFTGQMWSFEVHPIGGLLPENERTSSQSFYMRSEFQGPMRSLTAETNQPRMQDDRPGSETQSWQFVRTVQ